MHERFVEQILPASSSRRNVLKIGLEVNDVGHRDQQQAPAFVTGEVHPRPLLQVFQHLWLNHRALPFKLEQSRSQALRAHRLDQIVNGIEFKRLHRITVKCGDKNNRRRRFHPPKMARQLNAVHLRHANIDQHDIDSAPFNRLQRQHAVGGLTDHGIRHLGGDIG